MPNIHVGPRGGEYYMSKGKRVYLKKGSKATKSPRKSPRKSASKSPKSPRKSRGCTRQYTAKYENRPSPAFPANECCGQVKSRNGKRWVSSPDKNGVCKWKKV